MTTAKIILEQLGGQKFIAITGSNNFQSSEGVLTMHLVKNQSKAKYLRIEIAANDTYNMIFQAKGKDYTFPIVESISGIYADMLRSVFTKITGLETSL